MLKTLFIASKPFFPWLFWLTLIAVSVLLLIEIQPSEAGWPYFDKIVHTTMFLTLGVLGYIAYSKHKLAVWMGLACYGIGTEYFQSLYTKTRLGSINDWLADITGILLSLLIVYTIEKISSK